ncbi:MAG: hypothetical protein M1825_005764 [Sarcosagium campestre]|nr:MAG: hypothetical protein M1825_005764 [Sarcosagium campestre]
MSSLQGPNENVKFKLYWLEKSRSQRILWLLEELDLPYEIQTFKRQKDMLAPPELKDIHPLGKSPMLSIEAPTLAEPLLLAESSNIIEYVSDHFGSSLVPKRYADGKEGQVGGESEEWLRHRFLMHYAEGGLMVYLVIALIANNIRNSPVPFFIKPITGMIAGKIESSFLQPNFKTSFDFLESQISSSPGGGDYLCGKELTGADIMMSFPLIAARGRAGLTKEAYPKLSAYIERLEQRDAYKRAVQKIVDIDGYYEAMN